VEARLKCTERKVFLWVKHTFVFLCRPPPPRAPFQRTVNRPPPARTQAKLATSRLGVVSSAMATQPSFEPVRYHEEETVLASADDMAGTQHSCSSCKTQLYLT
jgi:hypothetical protein